MYAYILETGRRIAPFDEQPAELRIHNLPLRQTQERFLSEAGYRVETVDDLHAVRRFPCLVVFDDVYFTRQALNGFLRLVHRGTSSRNGAAATATTQAMPTNKSVNLRAALATSVLTERFAPTFQGRQMDGPDGRTYRAYDLYHLRQFTPDRPLDDQAELAPIPHRMTVRNSRVNRFFEPTGRFALPMSLVAMCPIQHWAALVTANALGLPSRVLEAAGPLWLAAMKLPLASAWRARSLRPCQVLGKSYFAGSRCIVHPSAHVEWSVLGNDVRIGPGAVVRGAVLSNRVEIGPNALVEYTTLGEKATVNGNVTLRLSVVGDEANVGAYFTQLSVLGRGAALCPASGTYDFNLRGNVVVSFQGRSVSCGSRLLGSCLGHRAFLGAEVTLASGQELPNGCILVRNPRQLVTNVNEGLPEGVIRMDRGRKAPRLVNGGPGLTGEASG
jgi:acetyltransferase-like isoleucine patch superfamily enzyme